MRFRVPEECAGVVHNGVALAIDGDRTVEAGEDAARALAAHGLRPAAEPEPEPEPEGQPGEARPRARSRRRGGGL